VPVHNPTISQHQGAVTRDGDMKTQTAIQRGARDVVVLAPPCEVALANDELEHEPDGEPGRVIDARCGWDKRHPEQHNRRAHILGP